MTTSQVASPTVQRAPIWPLLVAPVIAGVYYVALRAAFAVALPSVVFDASDIDLNDVASPHWGTHWIYRIFAEVSSLAFGTFVAAGIARERGRQAAIIGGLAISLFYLTRNAGLFYFVFLTASGEESIEPWYQTALEVPIILGAPFLGAAMSHSSDALNSKRTGFSGINRLHFLWLWVPTDAYAGRMIAPVIHLWLFGFIEREGGNRISDFMQTVIIGLPILVYWIPIVWGLEALAHANEASGWRRAVLNIVDSTIIIIGFFVASVIQFYLEKLFVSFTG